MSPLSSSQGIIHFGDFHVDLRSGELHENGSRIKLQVQPFQVLQTLLENAGALVSREELRKRIWPADTFVDFDHGLNNAVKKSQRKTHWVSSAGRHAAAERARLSVVAMGAAFSCLAGYHHRDICAIGRACTLNR